MKSFFCFLILVLSAGAEMTLADAAKSLGNQDGKVRSEATQLLKEGGWKSLEMLDKLETQDPEILIRMQVIREFVSLGLHLEGSPGLREVVLNLHKLTPGEGQNSLRKFTEELHQCPLLLAGLHSKIVINPWKPGEMDGLKKFVALRLKAAFSMTGQDFSIFEPKRYSAETGVVLFENLGSQEESLKAADVVYLKWLVVFPDLPKLFNKDSVMIELRRLRHSGEIEKALTLIDSLDAPQFVRQKRRWLAGWIKLEPFLEVVSDEMSVCRTLLAIYYDPDDPGEILETYRRFLERHPKLPAALGKELGFLEVQRLRAEGLFYEAYAALEGLPDSARFQNVEIVALAKWAWENQEKLVRGFPAIGEEKSEVARSFLREFLHVSSSDPFSDAHEQAGGFQDIFVRTPGKEAWREIVRKSGRHFLKVYLLVEEGKLWEELGRPKDERDSSIAFELGPFFKARPGLLKEFRAEEYDVELIRSIVAGLLDDRNVGDLKFCNELAEGWTKSQPALLEGERFKDIDKLRVYRLWLAGDRTEAFGLLAKSGIHDYDKGWLLGVLLDDEKVTSLASLLDDARFEGEVIARAFGYLVEPEGATDAAIQNALLLAQWNCRSEESPKKPLNRIAEVGKHALKAWRLGEDERAFDYMEESFWGFGRNSEWRHRLFPLWCHVLGRTDEALARLQENAESVHEVEWKRAHLLFAAERFEEALKYRNALEETPLLRDLLIAAEDWKGLGELSLSGNDHRKEVRVELSGFFGKGDSQARPTFSKSGNEYRDLIMLCDGSHPPVPAGPGRPPLTILKNLRTPVIGRESDPRAGKFRILDAFKVVQERWQAGNEKEARTLLVDCFSRLILDSETDRERIRVEFSEQSKKWGRSSSGFQLGMGELAILAARELQMPRELAGDLVWGLAHFPSRYRHDSATLASRYFDTAGDSERALLEVYFSFFRVEASSITYPCSRIAFYHYLRAMIGADQADFAEVKARVGDLIKHAPHQIDLVKNILQKLPDPRKAGVSQVVFDWWRLQIEEKPNEKGFQTSLETWREALRGGH